MTDTKSYHHGDLRSALLKAARARLASEGYEALSLRSIARDIGVAPSAPYAHFPSREALLWTLVREGARAIRERFAAAAALNVAPDVRLLEVCRSYLDYGQEEPELIRLLHTFPATGERVMVIDGFRALRIFERLVCDVTGADDVAEVRDAAFCCWSTIHGFAMLRLHKRMAPDMDPHRTAELVIRTALRQLKPG